MNPDSCLDTPENSQILDVLFKPKTQLSRSPKSDISSSKSISSQPNLGSSEPEYFDLKFNESPKSIVSLSQTSAPPADTMVSEAGDSKSSIDDLSEFMKELREWTCTVDKRLYDLKTSVEKIENLLKERDGIQKTITCRAAVNKEKNSPFVIETVEVAPPKHGEVRIKMSSTGLCHSDLHVLEGIFEHYSFPSILGHEGAGIIESVGPGVTEFSRGDHVVLLFEGYCGECDFCKHPKTNLCQKQPKNGFQLDGTARITCRGVPLTQLSTVSTFSEYTVTSVNNVTKVNPKAPINRLCIAGCAIPTGYGAAVQCAKVKPGSTCAIFGLGGVGMNVVLGCRDSKASKIIGIDLNPEKFPLAKELGCTDVLNPKDQSKPMPQVLAEMTNGGVDYCFVSVGIVEVMEEALECCHPMWGKTILIGIVDFGGKMKVGVWDFIFGRRLKGTYYGGYKAKLAIPGLVDKIVDGTIPLQKLISHVLPLDKINEGFDMLKRGEPIRAIIDFDLKK